MYERIRFNKDTNGKPRSRYFEDNRLGIYVEFQGETFTFQGLTYPKQGSANKEQGSASKKQDFANSDAFKRILNLFSPAPQKNAKVLTFFPQKQTEADESADAPPLPSAFIFIDLLHTDDKLLIARIASVNPQLQDADAKDSAYPKVRVLPNWYGAGASGAPVDGPGGGGPGEPAQDANDVPTDAVARRQKLCFHLPSALGVTAEKGKPIQTVNVFILDSVPWKRDQALVESANEMQTRFDTNTCAKLLQARFGLPSVPFTVWPSNNNNPRLPPENMIPGKDGLAIPDRYDASYAYEMYDHGLFIAGIVYSMAQDYQSDVRIHLVETTNAYGVTSYEALLDALYLVQKEVQKDRTPFVVNMSLILLNPQDAEKEYGTDAVEISNLTDGILNDILQEIKGHGVLVASAGNNSLLSPLFPAAAQGVISVGALVKGKRAPFQPARYSNQTGYSPGDAEKGIWTFGGDYVADPKNPDPKTYNQGMLGLSVSSASGLQWWAGTSFASGIVSGMLAVILSQNLANTGQAAQDYLFQKCNTQQNVRDQNGLDLGRVLNVTQG